MAEPPTPSGAILQPTASLRTWLADLTACQTLLAADDATEAAARIYLAEIDLAELSERWPRLSAEIRRRVLAVVRGEERDT